MCGRFVISETVHDLIRIFDVDEAGEHLPDPSWNVRPTDQIPVVLESNRHGPVVRRLESARWSLIPSFAKEKKLKYPTFNARSESVANTSTFKASVRSRRALIPANGYYEWHTVGKTKTPYYIHSAEGIIAFAGLYSWWRDPGKADDDPERWVLSATILTMDASGGLAEIHDRVPLIIPSSFWSMWLDPDTVGDQSLVDAAVASSTEPTESLQWHRVAPVRDNGPHLIEPSE